MREALLRLLAAGAGDEPVEDLLGLALPMLTAVTRASGLALAEPVGDALLLGARVGVLPADEDPLTWGRTGAGVALHDVELHGADHEVLVVARTDGPLTDDGDHELVVAALVSALARRRAAGERGHSIARFRGLVDASPRAILLVDGDGTVVQANSRASEMLAGDPVGHRACRLLPDVRTALGLTARLLDDRELVVDVLIAPLPHAGDAEQAWDVVFVEDASARLEREGLSTRLHEARMRRRQALEINDNVVQGLVAACYALDAERYPVVATYLRRTLDAARAMMSDLLDPLSGEDLRPGALVRRAPAVLDAPPAVAPVDVEVADGSRVLVVDDAADLRVLTRTVLDRVDGLTVVGEAADGLEGVEQATELQPDLVVLDLAMPRMDGLEALPRIKAAVPGVRVVVFSGFDEATLADQAVAAGADAYAAKGGSMRELVEVVTRTLREAATPV